LYIQAERGQLPELKRVLVSDGERVVMELDLETALNKLFGKPKISRLKTEGIEEDYSVGNANSYYNAILDAMNNGDWQSFGENFEKLGEVLEELE